MIDRFANGTGYKQYIDACHCQEDRKDIWNAYAERTANHSAAAAGVAIGNPERYVRKASHRGSKQQ